MSKTTRKLVPRDDRVTINHEFTSVEAFIAEYVTNISRTGVFIKTRAPLPVGTKVNLRFTVIMDDLETIEGIGEVVRLQEQPSGMGVVFVTLTSHSQDLISKLITRRRATSAVELPRAKARGRGGPRDAEVTRVVAAGLENLEARAGASKAEADTRPVEPPRARARSIPPPIPADARPRASTERGPGPPPVTPKKRPPPPPKGRP